MPNKKMKEAQDKLNEAIWEINDRFLIPTILLTGSQFTLAIALIFGGLKALRLRAVGRKVLVIACSFVVVFEIAQIGMFAMMQIQMMPIMEVHMSRVMEAPPATTRRSKGWSIDRQVRADRRLSHARWLDAREAVLPRCLDLVSSLSTHTGIVPKHGFVRSTTTHRQSRPGMSELDPSIAVYTGSFDPPTLGHMSVIERTSRLYDKLVVGVGINVEKQPLFSPEERVELVKQATAHCGNVEVRAFDELAVEFVRAVGSCVMVRGCATAD